MSATKNQENSNENADKDAAAIETLVTALTRLRYGTILLTVHDGKIVQLDITERTRFNGS